MPLDGAGRRNSSLGLTALPGWPACHYSADGVRFLESPRKEPYGMVAVFADAFGNRWELIAPAR